MRTPLVFALAALAAVTACEAKRATPPVTAPPAATTPPTEAPTVQAADAASPPAAAARPAASSPAAAARPAASAAAPTRWSGEVTLPTGAPLALTATFTRAADGALTATLDIPSQGLAAAPLTDLVDDGAQLAFTLPLPGGGARFAATQNSDGTLAEGHLEQSGGKFPLHLRRLGTDEPTAAAPPRPQTPTPPFPYTTRDATWPNTTDGVTLAGTLTLPPAPGPHPALLLLTGSGPQDRDETLFGHKPFLVLADALTRRGFAVLRVDDRGFGASTPGTSPVTVSSNLRDALASLDYLRAQPEVDPARAGLLGHSEGGLLAAMAAASRPDAVAFVVTLAGPALRGDALLLLQLEAILRATSTPEPTVASQLAAQRAVLTALTDGRDDEALAAAVAAAIRDAQASAPVPGTPTAGPELDAYVQAQVAAVRTPWFREFVTLDPLPHWSRVRCPVLALFGERDTQVPAAPNRDALAAAFAASGHAAATLEILPGLNHLFQSARTGAPDEYAQISETLAPLALDRLAAWLAATAAPKPR